MLFRSVFVPKKIEDEKGKILNVFKEVATLNSGKSFGELALINNTRRFIFYII